MMALGAPSATWPATLQFFIPRRIRVLFLGEPSGRIARPIVARFIGFPRGPQGVQKLVALKRQVREEIGVSSAGAIDRLSRWRPQALSDPFQREVVEQRAMIEHL